MGMNYYHFDPSDMVTCCECGQQVPKKRHIGKSSGGWCFSLHVGDDCPMTINEWQALLMKPSTYIQNEEREVVTVKEMLETITKRAWRRDRPMPYEDMRKNHAVPGPNGLLRHQVGEHCIAHGDGTYDYIRGSFS
jgi:hypothetical protein